MIKSRTNLYGPSVQWATRPDEERFWNLKELHDHLLAERASEREYDFSYADLSIVTNPDNQSLYLETRKGLPLHLSNWSFNQLCDRLGLAPSMVKSFSLPTIQAIMRERMVGVTQAQLPAPESDSDNQWELLDDEATEAPSTDDGMMKLLVKKNGNLIVKSVTSTTYGRKWNSDIVGLLREVAEPYGWRNPPARPAHTGAKRTRIATADDVLRNQGTVGGLAIKEGDTIAPAGLYHNDRNMFIFLVDDTHPIDDGSEGGMNRGFYISNSEVGERRTLSACFFGYKGVCGNHIIHGASNIVNIKLKHTKNSVLKFDEKFAEALNNYSHADKSIESRLIQAAKLQLLGKNKEEVVDSVYALKSRFPVVNKELIERGYDVASQWEHVYNASPNSVWGIVNGLSQVSQHSKFADVRNNIDRAAGSLMELVKVEAAPTSVNVPATLDDSPKRGRKATK